ncbi:MAG: hypothetical protein ACD_20C00109G0023 [uncultured bacterium]|nr:MAG: hypothetical protein ACD_20C00109G0023 [uncultured bacterium]HBH17967.1 hypothetical protein [Cyanobacteria bacterium UBA9579]
MQKSLVLLGLLVLFSQPAQAQMMNQCPTACPVSQQFTTAAPTGYAAPACPVAQPNLRVIREGVPLVRAEEVAVPTGAAAPVYTCPQGTVPVYTPYSPCPTGGAVAVVPQQEERGLFRRFTDWVTFWD